MIDKSLLIGQFATYPGHPITLMWLIVNIYRTFEDAARVEEGKWCPNALRNSDIPGAGGNVYEALDLLRYMEQKVVDFAGAVKMADDYWARCDNIRERRPETYKAGQGEADALKPRLEAKLREFLR